MTTKFRSLMRTALVVAAVGAGVSLSAVPMAHASPSNSGGSVASGKDRGMERRQRLLNRLANASVKEMRAMGREAKTAMFSFAEAFKNDACAMADAGATEEDLLNRALQAVDEIDAAAMLAMSNIDAVLFERKQTLSGRGASAITLARLDKAAAQSKRQVDRHADVAANRVAEALEHALEGCDDDDDDDDDAPPPPPPPPSDGGGEPAPSES